MKLIDKAAVVAEIEKLREHYSECKTRNIYEEGLKEGRLIGYKDALHKLNDIEVKEMDLEKLGEIARHLIAVKEHIEDMRLDKEEWFMLEKIGYPERFKEQKGEITMTQEDKELEIWKPIPNYEEYEVSTFGRVKRLAYDKPVCGGSFQHCNERILSPQPRKNGYQAVMLSKKGVVKSFLIHRLVAITFIPNPYNLPQVNHKDENPSNNCIDNLEWCDQKYNSNYGTSKERISLKLKNGVLSKPVQQYTMEGQFIKEYPSAIEVSRVLGLAVSSIVSCCNGNKKYTTCGGFKWKYTNSDKQIMPASKILQISKEGNSTLNTWNNITEASKSLSISRTAIANCLSGLSKTAGGYIWKKI